LQPHLVGWRASLKSRPEIVGGAASAASVARCMKAWTQHCWEHRGETRRLQMPAPSPVRVPALPPSRPWTCQSSKTSPNLGLVSVLASSPGGSARALPWLLPPLRPARRGRAGLQRCWTPSASPRHPLGMERRDHGRAATLGEIRRVACWVWLDCESCQHHVPLALTAAIIRWGAAASSDILRRSARCSRCGKKGATISLPGWGGLDVGGPVPFPIRRR
jgi:hypothetical protein